MKKILIYILGLYLISCEFDPDWALRSPSITHETIVPNTTSIDISIKFSTMILLSAMVQYADNPDFFDYKEIKMQLLGQEYSAKITNLISEKQYYIRYVLTTNIASYTTRSKSLTTLPFSIPIVETSSATTTDFVSFNLKGKVTDDGGTKITECGFVYSTSPNPTNMDKQIKIFSQDEFEATLTNLYDSYTYYIRAYATNSKGTGYGKTLIITQKVTQDGYIDGHAYVDLGLSVKWATCNIGASCPEEIGNYYAWGETETKNNYEWDNYKWYDGIGITKYPDKYYTGTSLFTMNLEPSDDAAHVIWRGSWRMPTNKECNELNKCRITEAVLNGVKGYKVTASNGKSIFFPQDGYWSSTIHLTDPFLAYGIFSDCSSRYIGRCVRPVCP